MRWDRRPEPLPRSINLLRGEHLLDDVFDRRILDGQVRHGDLGQEPRGNSRRVDPWYPQGHVVAVPVAVTHVLVVGLLLLAR